MPINLSVPELTELKPRITVIGVGGAGGNAVNNMIESQLEGVEFVVANTDAQAVGLNLAETDFLGKARTANGTVRVAYVTLDNVTLGPVTDRNVPASINDGEMDTSLLGMSYLQRFSKFEISLGELVLTR